MKTIIVPITILLSADFHLGTLHGQEPTPDPAKNAAQMEIDKEVEQELARRRRLEELENMKQITVSSGNELGWSMRVWPDGSVRFYPNVPLAYVDFGIYAFPPGTCDQDSILREIPCTDNPPPDFDKVGMPSIIIKEANTKAWKRLYPEDPTVPIRFIRHMIAKVPEKGWDESRDSLIRYPLIHGTPNSEAGGKLLEQRLLTPGQAKALRGWRGGTGEWIKAVLSMESPELVRIFGDDSFLRVRIGNTATMAEEPLLRDVIFREGKAGIKVYSIHDAPMTIEDRVARPVLMGDVFSKMLADSGFRIRSREDARLAAGAYLAFVRQRVLKLAVADQPGGFLVTWEKAPLELHGSSEKHHAPAKAGYAKLPVSIRFRCDPEGRLLNAEPIPPKPADAKP